MKRTLNPIVLLLLCLTTGMYAQDNMAVLLHNGTTFFPENAREYAQSATIGSNEMIDGHYYRMLQFNEIPKKSAIDALEQMGIKLLEYIPHNTYVAAISTQFDVSKLEQMGVRSIQPIEPGLKLSNDLKYSDIPDWARQKSNVLVMLKFYKDLKHEDVLRYCEADGIKVLRSNGYNNFLRTSVPLSKVQALASLPYVAFLELVPPPDVPDDIIGRSLHRSNVIDSQFPGGRHYTGQGVNVCVRDDGFVGPHIDFQGRIDNSYIEPQSGSHGDGVSGIVGGAGNLDPWNRGMAAGSFLYIINYEADFLDETMELHTDKNVLVTNSSYTNGCNTGYTEITETIDQQLYNNPTLLHVFSAGNANNSDCGYGAGNQWGNITGGHKQAKNAVATANLNGDGTLDNSSSRGPAHDGRLKPDISAHGANQISTDENNAYQVFGGTSAASPGIAGITAQLHQAYQELNGGEIAEAALLKSILLNTANDLGNTGPDFKFGWGHVNAYRAVRTLEEQRYFKSSVDAGVTNTHTIDIPDNVLQARVMVYWMDPEATVMTSKALINDIDCWMTGTDTTQYLPWLLDPTPNATALNTPAAKGVDVLNNMEQVAIDNPAPGEYTLHVNGKELPFGAHDYWVVWEFRTAEITVTHPVGGEAFAPGETVRIHWDTYGNGDDTEISYSADGGTTYNPVATVPGNVRMRDWVVPNEISGQVKIRVSRGTESDESDEVFSIAPRPANVQVIQACPDYLKISWDPVDISSASATTSYEVYVLGDKYMEPVATVTTNEAEIPTIDANPTIELWFAVKTIGENGIRSERTIASSYNGGLLNCTQQFDASLLSIESPSAGSISGCGGFEVPVVVTIKNTGLEALEDLPVAYVFDNNPPVVEIIPGTLDAGTSITYTFTTLLNVTASGDYSLEVYTALPGDLATFNDALNQDMSLSIYPGDGEPLDYSEGFEGGVFPPAFYSISNPDGQMTWVEAQVMGAAGTLTTAIFMNNYVYETTGEEDALLVIPVNLEGASNPLLSFDVAYAYYNDTWFDGLRVEISTDCGATFTETVYEKFKDQLATAGAQTDVFTPNNANQWRKEAIDLTDYIGNKIVVKFVCINGYGNSLYLDNINILNLLPPVAGFDLSATEICEKEQVTFTSTSTGELASYAWDFGAGAAPATSTSNGPVTATFNEAGTLTVSLTVSNIVGESTFTQDLLVNPVPKPDFTFEVNGGTATFTNTSQDANTYFWDFGDGGLALSENPAHTYDTSGIFTVKLIASNDCGSVTFETDVNVVVNSLNELGQRIGVALTPNPNRGNFNLLIENDRAERLWIDLLDVRGVVHQTQQVSTTSGVTTVRFEESGMAPGMYFIKIHSEDGFKVLKTVIE